MTKEEIQESIEHRDVLLNIRAILATNSGKQFFKYLFKHFDVAQVPELGLDGLFLHDKLGFLRAGNAIFKLVSEANHEMSGLLLAQVEKERYEKLYGKDEHEDGSNNRE